MIGLSPTVERLEQKGFSKVAGVVEWAGLKAAPAHSPALFVMPMRAAAEPNKLVGVHDQRVAETLRVVVVIKPSARVPGKPSEQLKEEVDKVIDALTGWSHPDACTPCDYAGGALLSADGWGIAWAIDFRTAWRLRKGTQ